MLLAHRGDVQVIAEIFFLFCAPWVKSGVDFTFIAPPRLDSAPPAPTEVGAAVGAEMRGPVWEAPTVTRGQVLRLSQKSPLPKCGYF